jgi:TRAP-type C4-dicarboxylate transport system substrate-binding protein
MKLFAAAAIIAATVASSAQAETTFRAASAFGPAHMNAIQTYPYIFEKVRELTDGRYTGQDYPSGLLTPQEMNNGLRDGIADMGAVIMLYFPSDFVESSLPGELSILGTNPYAIAAAATEYIVTCQECVAEFNAIGQVYLGSGATAPYNILSTKPANALSDLAGLRIRATGAVFSRWVESLGASVVQIPSSEVFEALSQGVADGSYGALPELINGRLFDVIKYVTLVNVGVFASDGVANVSKLFWDDLSPEDRTAFVKAVQYGSAKATETWLSNADKARAEGEAMGIRFDEPSEEILARKQAFTEAHLAGVVDTLTGKGVTNAAEKVERYRQLVEKWEGLVEKTGNDVDALGDLRYQEIWAKVDVATFAE